MDRLDQRRSDGAILQHVETSLRLGQDQERAFSLEPEERPLSRGVTVAICTYRRPPSLERCLHSLALQGGGVQQLIIVDASPDDLSQQVIANYPATERLATEVLYVRVSGQLRGLTRQRNLALRLAKTDLIAFFDDDIVLCENCVAEMERVHRARGPTVVGVGAYIENTFSQPSLLWRLRLRARLVGSLQPGRYYRSGMSTPWSFLAPTSEIVEGDWLHGCAMMWRTETARQVGFFDGFVGYAQGEDLDFSLQVRRRGRLVVAGSARALHLMEQGGRPDPYKRGYMEILYRYHIHRRGLHDRTWRDSTWFAYAWVFDTVMLLRNIIVPKRSLRTLKQIAGRVRAALYIARASGGRESEYTARAPFKKRLR